MNRYILTQLIREVFHENYADGKKKGKSTKGKSTKGSYRAYLSKRLKEVKKAHPSWPQSKVFKEAVKGWKSSK